MAKTSVGCSKTIGKPIIFSRENKKTGGNLGLAAVLTGPSTIGLLHMEIGQRSCGCDQESHRAHCKDQNGRAGTEP